MDLYIIEFPVAFKPGDVFYPKDENGRYIYYQNDLCATWEALEACKDAGLTKSLGVSNFNCRQLELILNKPGLRHKPVSNQVSKHTLVCHWSDARIVPPLNPHHWSGYSFTFTFTFYIYILFCDLQSMRIDIQFFRHLNHLQNIQHHTHQQVYKCCCLQVECHPYFTQPKLLEFCRQNDIVIVGYSPLGTSRDTSWYPSNSSDLVRLFQFS